MSDYDGDGLFLCANCDDVYVTRPGGLCRSCSMQKQIDDDDMMSYPIDVCPICTLRDIRPGQMMCKSCEAELYPDE